MTKIYSIGYEQLKWWCEGIAKLGDIAIYQNHFANCIYIYKYAGPVINPIWSGPFKDEDAAEYLNLTKIQETNMEKKCENCKYFKNTDSYTWCTHKDHAGMYVPKFTSCPEYTLKEETRGPFDNIKFYIKDSKTGEVEARYICEDCSKEMKTPYRWWMKVPYGNAVPDDVGYHYRCEECDNRKES